MKELEAIASKNKSRQKSPVKNENEKGYFYLDKILLGHTALK